MKFISQDMIVTQLLMENNVLKTLRGLFMDLSPLHQMIKPGTFTSM